MISSKSLENPSLTRDRPMVLIPVSPGVLVSTWHLGDLQTLGIPCNKLVGRNVPSASSRQEIQGSHLIITGKEQAGQPVKVETIMLIWPQYMIA